MSDCNCVTLKKLEGPLHPSGKDYCCKECGRQYVAKPLEITVSYGTPAPLADLYSGQRAWLNDFGKLPLAGAQVAQPVDYEKKLREIENSYVAWLCFRGGRDGEHLASVHTCDSNFPGAFKVYRWPAIEAAIRTVAGQPEGEKWK
jgi:hypothetical protein